VDTETAKDPETERERVERQSAALKKELSLTNLVLTQVLYIAGLSWLGAAAKLGSSHVFFWIPAALLFYVPSAIVVIHLTREMPLEGGLYQWAKLRWGSMAGFLIAWNLWLYAVLLLSELGLVTTNNLAYALGPSGAWLADSTPAVLAVATGLTIGLVAVAVRGLALGKRIHDVGGVTLVVLLLGMLFFAVPRWLRGTAAVAPIAFTVPALSLLNLNILGKMSFGAFSGSEGVAVFAGEIHDPDAARALRRSVLIAAPIVTTIFTFGTACMLAFARPEDLDLISPVAQNLSLGARSVGLAGSIVPLAMALMLFARIGTGSMVFNMASRLPMLAGWDHLLPAWFTRLHPRYRTPAGSIVFVGGVVLVFAVLANLGVGSQEAYQLLSNASGISYALTYLVMFSIPLAAPGPKASWPIRIAALSGFSMTLLYVVLSVFPIIDVKSGSAFTLKVSGIILASNALGAGFFLRARRRRAAGAS
jgi:glutamate:GABA antiporter